MRSTLPDGEEHEISIDRAEVSFASGDLVAAENLARSVVENAESLSFEDEAFNFVLCKEAYHHFPRPMIALYEMLRVARKAVVLIEPFDRFVVSPLPERAWNGAKRLAAAAKGRPVGRPARFQYESVGNFIYTISHRELEKVMRASRLSTFTVTSHVCQSPLWQGVHLECAAGKPV